MNWRNIGLIVAICLLSTTSLMGQNVKNVAVDPKMIDINGSSKLTITLDRPAPNSNFTVAISHDFDGPQDTLKSVPVSFKFEKGKDSASITLQSQRVNNYAHKLIFTAFVGSGPRKSAQLNIK
jgi:hypothetical protein